MKPYELVVNGDVFVSGTSQTHISLVAMAFHATYGYLYKHIIIRHNGNILWKNGRHTHM